MGRTYWSGTQLPPHTTELRSSQCWTAWTNRYIGRRLLQRRCLKDNISSYLRRYAVDVSGAYFYDYPVIIRRLTKLCVNQT